MKILLYTEGLKTISKSGLGKAIKHQMKALEDNKIEYTTNLKDNYDILHINFYGPKSYFYAKKARKNGKKIVYHAHSTEEDFRNSFLFSNLVSPLFKKWLIRCYSLGDYIITPTEYSKRLLENYHLNRPIKAISNGVDTKFFERNEKAGMEFRKKYGYTKKDKIIVGIGLYIKRKGILDFVELAKRLPEYQFIWFGHSPLWASPREIKKAVTTKLPNLKFAGYVESSVIKSALSGADLYLFPTLEETEGIPIIEALTSKIPTLIRDIPVFEEYKANKVVYKAKDLDDFEKKIKKILEKKLPDLTEAGYVEAKKKDIKTVGQELVNTYEEVLKMRRRREKKSNTGKILGGTIFLIALVTAMLFLLRNPSMGNNLKPYERSFEINDIPVSITLYSNDAKKAEKALKKAEQIYQNYAELTDRENGPLKEMQEIDSQQDTVQVDSKLYDMIVYGKEWYDKSNGIFNIHMGEVTDFWQDYFNGEKEFPKASELQKLDTDIEDVVPLGLEDKSIYHMGCYITIPIIVILLLFVIYRITRKKYNWLVPTIAVIGISLGICMFFYGKITNLSNLLENHHMNLDLTNLTMGHATDEVAEYFEKHGFTKYLINASSLMRVGDYYEEEGKYILVVSSPFKDVEEEALTTVHMNNGAVASKGIYQDYFTYNEKDYSKIFSSKTYMPVDNMVGVTVVAKDAKEAEVLATILFSMSIPDGQKYIQNYPDVYVMWAYLDDNGVKRKLITENFYDLK